MVEPAIFFVQSIVLTSISFHMWLIPNDGWGTEVAQLKGVLNFFSRLLSNMGTSFFLTDDWIKTCSTYKSCDIALDVWLLGE